LARQESLGLSDYARYGFTELEATSKNINELETLLGASCQENLKTLSAVANPDQALESLIRLSRQQATEIKALLAKSDSAQRLCQLLGASSALTEFIERHPNQLQVFSHPPVLKDAETYQQNLLASISSLIKTPFESTKAWDAIRIGYRTELLEIAIYDLTKDEPQAAIPDVAAALADIAAAAIEAGLQVARAELKNSSDHGVFTEAEVENTLLAVIAMGKCGARELNYISDVDVIFVADSASEYLEPQRAVEVATKLATRMMRAMDGTASEPMLWQVDPNLRPEGKSGALVRTLDSHVVYYDRWAQSWEFQALLKARPIAGDKALGERYVSALSPKVWSSSTRENFVESVQRMRERVTEFIPAEEIDRQLKLGPGGLRDIEFTVQLLQLVHGRTDESVRQRDTVSAIHALTEAGYIGRSDANEFSAHYKFLRLLEHRIQMSEMRRTHLMPILPAKQRSLARSVSVKLTADDLLEKWDAIKVEVRALHQRIFYRPLLSAMSKLGEDSLSLSSEQVIDRLRAIGFVNPKGALDQIQALTSGLSRRAVIQKQLLPVLLQWFSEGTDPDAALLSFRRLSEDLGDSHWYLRMLRDSSGAAERMTQVLSNSRLATSLFERIPEAAAWFERLEELNPMTEQELTKEFDAVISRHDSADDASTSIRNIRRRETLRIAIGAVLGELDIEQVARGLSDLTACYLRAALDIAIETIEEDSPDLASGVDFAIIAMGRFGGEELGFGSDADVMYLYKAGPGIENEVAQKVSERIIAEMKRITSDQVLEFQIDIDLRPEGKNGPVVRSIDSYEAYYQRWSDTWEAQALLRARPIAGSAALQNEFLELINRYRYPSQFSSSAATEIRRIKARVETERLPLGADPKRHLKLGRGSLSDVEWLVQLLQMQHGAEHKSIRTPKTLDALAAMVSESIIAEHDARVLSEAWLLASRLRSASVLWANKSSDVLPSDRRQLEGMARILEYPRGSASVLEEDYLAFTRRSRMVYERLFFGDVKASDD
jgi:[glutamine synthetase] adenylyltransferase / [glutamine synthetase]-adenylyl-L-tyrosine phosphorylase